MLAGWCTSCRASPQYHPPGASFNPSQVRRSHSCNTREAEEKLRLTRNSTTRDASEEAELISPAPAYIVRHSATQFRHSASQFHQAPFRKFPARQPISSMRQSISSNRQSILSLCIGARHMQRECPAHAAARSRRTCCAATRPDPRCVRREQPTLHILPRPAAAPHCRYCTRQQHAVSATMSALQRCGVLPTTRSHACHGAPWPTG